MNLRDFFINNSWWGKILGAFFGYLTAGPTGALLGLLIGNFFDRGLMSHLTNPHWFYFKERRDAVQKIFFEATFSLIGYIAKADGRVSEAELQITRQLMDEMHLSKEQRLHAMRLFNEGKQSHFPFREKIKELQFQCHDNPNLLKLFMDIQYRVAQIDGLSAPKIKVLDQIFTQLGFSPFHRQYRFYEDFGQQQSNSRQRSYSSHSSSSSQQKTYSHQSYLDQAYALLELSPQATQKEVKRAYRQQLSKNHPDKLIAQGLPPEMIKMANEKTQQIVKAYDLICQAKGW